MVRVELDVRTRVGDGDWISLLTPTIAEDECLPGVAAQISEALRRLADEVEAIGGGSGP